jgi:Cdc6-like AAA superfamily ATPase
MLLTKCKVEKDVKETRDDVKGLGFKQSQGQIERWLSPPDPSTNYNKARQQRQEGSGLWFLQIDAFTKWKTRRNSFLWLYGIPGCGKTILSSTIIEDLEKAIPRPPVLYFYFVFNDTRKQTLESMVRSLISQLNSKYGDSSKELDSLFSSCENGHRQPTCESLCNAFLRMIEKVKEVWIVLDALDECNTRKGGPTEGLLSWMSDILVSEQSNVHLLITSRPEQDIKSGVSKFAHNDNVVPIQNDLITDDIRAYVRARVKEGNRLKRWRARPDVQVEIEARLMEKANGM